MPFSRLHLIAVFVLSATWAQSTDLIAVNSLQGITQVSKEHSDPLKSPLSKGPEIRVSSGIGYAMWKDKRLGVGLPHITRFPDTGVMIKVNEELGRELQKRRETVAECLEETDSRGRSWEEQVSVSLFSADVLSIVRRSDYYCGGNHPNTVLEPLVYDLHTGKTLDLQDVFEGQKESAPLVDGTVPDGPSHRLLLQLFLRHHKIQEGCADVEYPPETALKIFFTARGLVVAPELPHVIQACGEEILIPYAELRTHLKCRWRPAS
ncbi:MAG TPA: hypothetical protein VJA94_03810 [Candidatus Angelobacter sp.]